MHYIHSELNCVVAALEEVQARGNNYEFPHDDTIRAHLTDGKGRLAQTLANLEVARSHWHSLPPSTPLAG